MEEIILVNDAHYILATSAMADDRTRVLKHGETFAVFDRYGDVQPVGRGAQGLYHEGTRFLSRLEFTLHGARPLLLSSTVRDDNALLAVDLTNPDIKDGDRVVVPRGTLHLFRSKFIWQGCCFERLRLCNYGTAPIPADFALAFEADYADIFEVRGTRRARRGVRRPTVVEPDGALLSYEGLDGVVRKTRVTVSLCPESISETRMAFRTVLQPTEEVLVYLRIACESTDSRPTDLEYEQAFTDATRTLKQARAHDCVIYTSNEQFNDWVNRSLQDLHMMVMQTPEGPYPCAGVPWFNTPFGRDGIIAALEFLWVNPALARGVLAYLAAAQATEVVPEQDAEPGKILHETRKGEMPALDEVPFRKYYGTIDATPLFVMLAGAYYERTADEELIKAIWPNIERALRWIDTYGDQDGDGFVEYVRHTEKGLANQGWKDAHDAVFHEDGTMAEGPIALCEAQGYVYAAKRCAADLAAVLGHRDQASRLLGEADALKDRFEEVFWCEDLSTYALALDGRKRPCRVRTSNAGHCLWTGIAGAERARRLAESLVTDPYFSGWGIRTLATSEARYNPMSYHNGSVWPHDNALIAMGMARYGFKPFVLKILTGLFDSSIFVELHRLPELFCGFVRRAGQSPTLYPVACAPQAWAAGAVFLILQACLGLSVQAPERKLFFRAPSLPPSLQRVRIENLRVGEATVDLQVSRQDQDVGINILRREGPVEVVIVK